MKKVILTLVALLSMTVMQAQEKKNDGKCECKKEMKHHREPMKLTAEQRTDRMAKELSLTDAQKAQVLALNKDYPIERPQKVKDGEKPDFDKMKAQRKEYNETLKNILTEEQFEKYKKMQKHHKHRGHRGHHGHGGPRPEMPPMD